MEGWGAGVLRRLATDLKNELSNQQGYSERNLKLMTQFYREYPGLFEIGQQAVAQLPDTIADRRTNSGQDDLKGQQPVADINALVHALSWTVNILLIQKVKNLEIRKWYMRACIEQGWGRDILAVMIKSNAHDRQGAAVTNFDTQLPQPHAQLAKDTLKDPYIFDFLTLDKPFRERELEAGLVGHLEKFLLELGAGFAFVGRQVHLDVAGEDFYIDLLFYHLRLRSFVVIDLKIGPFKPEYAGKINFYCNVVDDQYRYETDNPTIGLILCQDKKRVLAEYALRGMNKRIGISEYELTRALPEELKSALPTVEEIETELSSDL
jgi:predicted nuclease of restriction endonuclease-like (RecB) superfamily